MNKPLNEYDTVKNILIKHDCLHKDIEISQTRADIIGKIGNVVINSALQGDFKAAEFYLRSKGGWSPNSTVNEVEQETDPDEDLAAVDSVMSLLGKNINPDEDNS